MAQSAERPIAVYRLRPVTFWVTIFSTLLLQAFLPLILPLARLFDLPLLVVIYISLMRRTKVFGALLGAGVGLAQDALSHSYLGMFGMAKTLVGYLAAWASVRFDLERLLSRFVLTAVLVAVHSVAYYALQYLPLGYLPAFQPLDLASTVLVNVALALILFQVLDRFRRPV